jgi:uncharacterized membrane protein YccC
MVLSTNRTFEKPLMTRVRILFQQVHDKLSSSYPGLLRLHSAGKVAATVSVTIVALYALAQVFGQPVTGALLGMMMSMQSASITKEPDPHQQIITLLLVLLSSSIAVTLGVLLSASTVVGAIGLVVVMFIVAYLRRFGSRGSTAGMAAYMPYFLLVVTGSLGSSPPQISQIPWFIGDVIFGTVCGFLMNSYVLRDHPERILHRMLPVLGIQIAAIITTLREALDIGTLDKHIYRRLNRRVSQLNKTGLMAEQQLEQIDTRALPSHINKDTFMRGLFDIELSTESMVAPALAAASSDFSQASKTTLSKMLETLQIALHERTPGAALQNFETYSMEIAIKEAGDSLAARRLAHAAGHLATALIDSQRWTNHTDEGQLTDMSEAASDDDQHVEAHTNHIDDNTSRDDQDQDLPKSFFDRLLPTTRQAIQIAIATGLATIVGVLLSSQRWYWSVIVAFVIFTGTSSRGDVLIKGWQRMFGTLCGVVLGVLIATVVGGNTIVSIVIIVICIFTMFYWMQANYAIMTVAVTTMLALLYGLLGEFVFGLLLTRLEETAVGAVIGIAVALFILPTHTSTIVRDGISTFLDQLSKLVDHASAHLLGETSNGDLIAQARELDQNLSQLLTSAKPLTQGFAGSGLRSSVQHTMLQLRGCEYYARRFARVVNQIDTETLDTPIKTMLKQAAHQTNSNIEALTNMLAHHHPAVIRSAGKQLDSVEDAILPIHHPPDYQYLLNAGRDLRYIDQIIVRLASDLNTTVEAQ